ncbi:MAG: hypothetical protein ACI8O8_002412 [Oleiphilaceae bacterium]
MWSALRWLRLRQLPVTLSMYAMLNCQPLSLGIGV